MSHNRNYNKVYLRTIETDIAATGVDGDFIFPLDPFAPRNNLLEYFNFVDSGGDLVTATGGDVIITFSSGSDIFQTIDSGSFTAASANLGTRTKPNGYGKADKMKVTLSSVTGAVGFVGLVTQNVS